MKNVRMTICLVVVCVMAAVNFTSADNIGGINIDFVTIGNAGNPGDPWQASNPCGDGSVDYIYRIGKYEVSVNQWQAINNAAGIGNGGYWDGDQPVANISWYDAARFTNYLTTGDTEDGVYKFSGGSLIEIMDHQLAGSTYGIAYFLPTENEWYKAAYYTGSGYSGYANGLDTIPEPDNGWNYFGGDYDEPWNVDMGATEQNDTRNMTGNVWEWTESWAHNASFRRIRQGAYWDDRPEYFLKSSGVLAHYDENNGSIGLGFRIASIPEPATLSLLGLGGLVSRRACVRRSR